MFIKSILAVLLSLSLIGCATTGRGTTPTGTRAELQARVSDLEKQLQEKEAQIQDLEAQVSKVKETEIINKEEVDVSKVTPEQIQAALKKAGFYTETVDGKLGKKTKDAVKEFQKANGLKVDGKVGKQTWSKLQKYLE
ncbi:MAG: peptidoglycan-binding domain-containing protein [Candidatus Omnitrophota bacterium]|nr:peptidoglycan-binding domain-containing protein [Candidatus Omnitrophota bacterium]